MSEVNKTAQAKVDTRKTEINKGIIIFNKMGIWVIVIGLLVLGTIIAAAGGGNFFQASNIQSILKPWPCRVWSAPACSILYTPAT